MKLKIRGIPIVLYERTQQMGTDDFNRPVYAEQPVTVENVLVGEPSTEDVTAELNLSGKRLAYTLAIPKGDAHDWTNATVEFWGQKFRTVGEPTRGIDENIPLQWNAKVKVERFNSDG